MTLHRVLYCSRNLVAMGPDAKTEIDRILAVSRANNARDGLTGGLILTEGWFAQVLEGPRRAAEATFERIQCDGRHGCVVVLRSERIDARVFPDWSMAFAGGGQGDARFGLPGLRDGVLEADRVLRTLRDVVEREYEWLA